MRIGLQVNFVCKGDTGAGYKEHLDRMRMKFCQDRPWDAQMKRLFGQSFDVQAIFVPRSKVREPLESMKEFVAASGAGDEADSAMEDLTTVLREKTGKEWYYNVSDQCYYDQKVEKDLLFQCMEVTSCGQKRKSSEMSESAGAGGYSGAGAGSYSGAGSADDPVVLDD